MSAAGELGWDEADIRPAIELLSKRWAIPVVVLLWSGPVRRVRLREQLTGISDKVLTATLKQLEENGVISRRFYEAVPPRVEYELTMRGRSLSRSLIPLAQWARVDGVSR
jgi:DNA-binding HxlR family transcriptional regulator